MNFSFRFFISLAPLLFVGHLSAFAAEAFWSFDTWKSGDGEFTNAVTAHTFSDTPTLKAGGTQMLTSGGAESFTAFNGTTWLGSGGTVPPGHSLAWSSGSKDNFFSVVLNTQGGSSLHVEMDIRPYASPEASFLKVEYDAGAGFVEANIPLPPFPKQGEYGTWAVDLSEIKEIFGKTAVTLKWTAPDMPANGSLRVDNLQIHLN